MDSPPSSSTPDQRPPTPPRLAAIGIRLVLFLAAGFIGSILVAIACAIWVDPLNAIILSAESFRDEDQWSVTIWDRPGAMLIHSLRGRGQNWSPLQATGAPDSPGQGDKVTAWASSSSDGQAEWLMLDYDQAVIPQGIRVHENDAPGAVVKVSVLDQNGQWVQAWKGADPTPAGSGAGISPIPLKVDFPVKRIRIDLDSASVQGWNEIDAVELVGRDGSTQWASGAAASSWYGSQNYSPNNTPTLPEELLPEWAPFANLARPLAFHLPRKEERLLEVRGWPMVCLWGERKMPGPNALTPAPPGGMLIFTGTGRAIQPAIATTAAGATPGLPPILPHNPIWGAMAVNSIFYAALFAITYFCLAIPRRFFREVSRMRRGGCIACGYDLQFNFQNGCPECGWRRTGQT